jgi:hypothetical protein
MTTFVCTKCGICCRKVDNSEFTRFLDRGDGTCRNFNTETNLCSIYENRPLVCNVEKMYYLYFQSKMSLHSFYKLNAECCLNLQEEANSLPEERINTRKAGPSEPVQTVHYQ